ncbi:MAG: hypothetical protein HDR04_09200 [Lachnospiraceae bacterium]|nr:hypothetical protein [Lachnospiraceae bacterium]
MEQDKQRPRRYHTYTKKMMTRIINVALVDMQFPFLLALLGREQIAETLGGLIVTEIIGVFLVYCVKSFTETREEQRVRLKEQYMYNNETENGEVAPVQPEYEENGGIYRE